MTGDLRTKSFLRFEDFLPDSDLIKKISPNKPAAVYSILASFAIKWPKRDRTFEQSCFILAVLCWKICWYTNAKEISQFATRGLAIKKLRIYDLRAGTPKKFMVLWLRNEPKKLRICKKTLHAHLWIHPYDLVRLIIFWYQDTRRK